MNSITSTLLVAAAVGAVAPHAPSQIANLPGYDEPARPWTSVEDAQARLACRDRIEQARAAAGQPKLDQNPESADKSEMLYAVDRRIDDCSVLVPVKDPTAVRPSPPPEPPRMRSAHPQN